MRSAGSLGILAVAIFITLILVSAATSSVILENQTASSDSFENLVNEVTTDLTSYLKIQQIIGRTNHTATNNGINQLAIRIRLLVSGTVNLADLTLELIIQDNVLLLSYQQNATMTLGSGALFTAESWKLLTPQTFAMLIINDEDQSITTGQTLNKNTDTGFLLISLPEDLALHAYDTCELRIIPNPGHVRQITIDVPFQTTSIAILYEEA
jgi:archaellin